MTLRPTTVPLDAGAIAGAEALAVANIDSPTELNSRAGTVAGERRICYQVAAGDDVYTIYAWETANSGGVDAPYVMAGSSGFWVAIAGKYTNGSINADRLVSRVATGTAPLTVASTTVVANLNASQLLGSTWAVPGSIGATTPAAGAFTTLSSSGAATVGTTLGVTGASTLSSTLGVTGITSITNTTAATSSTNGALVVSGGLGLAGDLHILGGFRFNGTSTADGFYKTNNTSAILFGGGNGTGVGAVLQMFGGAHASFPNQGYFQAGGANIAMWNATEFSMLTPLKLANTAVAGTPAATHTVTIKDGAGTTYRVLCVV